MNTIATANENSSLHKVLEESVPQTSPFHYALSRNVPSYAPHRKHVILKDWDNYGDTLYVDVPRAGVLVNVRARITFTTGGGENAVFSAFGGPAAFQSIELRSRDALISRIYPEDIVDDFKKMPSEKQAVLGADNLYAETARTIATGTAAVMHINIPLPHVARLNNQLWTKFAEPLELRAEMTAQKNWFGSATPAATATSKKVEFIFEYVTPNERETAAIKRQLASKGPEGLARLLWSSVVETKAITNGDTSTTMIMRQLLPTFRLILMVRSKATFAAGSAGERFTLDTGHVSKVELLSSGVVVRDWDAQELLMVSNAHGNHYAAVDGYYALPLNFSDVNSHQTGFLSLRNITDPQLKISHTDVGVTTSEFRLVYQYYVEESMSPDDGRINVRVLD
jgi:hypothetical protein